VVQPAPAEPICTRNDAITKHWETRNVQNESMFSVGKAMSRAPIMRGIRRLPNAPIIIGVMAKKIMMRPCIVKMVL
jgi:hypothetical protein